MEKQSHCFEDENNTDLLMLSPQAPPPIMIILLKENINSKITKKIYIKIGTRK